MMIFPPMPETGSTILLIAPSSPLSEDQPIDSIAQGVERLGFHVRIDPSCQSSSPCGYAAAPPELRAAGINAGFSDPDISAIWCVRGGSTAWQLPPLLDYAAISAHPKPFIGFSDVTSLHLAIQKNCHLVTYHGPTANRILKWEDDPFTWPSLLAALYMEKRLCVKNAPGEPIKSLRPGTASGPLTGGNLSLVVQSLGTPWQIDAKDRILYLEDVDEPVYALDRLLSQLHYAGVLQSAAGIVLGAFTHCRNAYRESYGPEELLKDFFSNWPRPVLYNLHSAHCTPMVTLPLGAHCTIDGSAASLMFSRNS